MSVLTFRTEGFKETPDGPELDRRKAWRRGKHIALPWASGQCLTWTLSTAMELRSLPACSTPTPIHPGRTRMRKIRGYMQR